LEEGSHDPEVARRAAVCIDCREAIDPGLGLWLDRKRLDGSGTCMIAKHLGCLSGGDLERMDPEDLDALDDLRAGTTDEGQATDDPDERIGGAAVYRFLHEDAAGWRGELWRLRDAAGELAGNAGGAESFGVVAGGGTAGVIVLGGQQAWDSDLPGVAITGILIAVQGTDEAARQRAIKAAIRAATEDLIGEVEGELARQAQAPKEAG